MMTVKEFKEWLNQFDDDVLVEVVSGYDYMFFQDNNIKSYQYNDCENSWCGRKVLTLGS